MANPMPRAPMYLLEKVVKFMLLAMHFIDKIGHLINWLAYIHTTTYLLSIIQLHSFYIPLNVAATCHVLIQCLESSRSLQITKTHGLFYGK